VATTAIFAALQWECRPILRRLDGARRETLDGFPAWRARTRQGETLLLKTGIGLERAARAAQAACRAADLALLLSSGCAGALAAELAPGDLVIAASVGVAHQPPLPTDRARREQALDAARRAGLAPRTGHVLSSPQVLGRGDDKRAAAAAGALAVEMEGAAIASAAAERGLPFLAVRSILDTVDSEIDDSGGLVDPVSGSVRPLAVAIHLLRHPGAIPRMMAAKRMMDAAEASLERFFAEYL